MIVYHGQWKYNLPSAEIVKKITPEMLYQSYYPLHEASIENGADKLNHHFFQKS